MEKSKTSEDMRYYLIYKKKKRKIYEKNPKRQGQRETKILSDLNGNSKDSILRDQGTRTNENDERDRSQKYNSDIIIEEIISSSISLSFQHRKFTSKYTSRDKK